MSSRAAPGASVAAAGRRSRGAPGLTLIELLVASAILGMLAVAAMRFTFAGLRAQTVAETGSTLSRDGLVAMERMAAGVRTCAFLLIPNAHAPVRNILAIAGTDNDDGDFYFGDSLFPRVDEDTDGDMTSDGRAGISGVDDDGDGAVDEGSADDDDEDGRVNEDPLDGMDNDGDGNIDEDFGKDATDDGVSGVIGMDDDGDGLVDEGGSSAKFDDDEDGLDDEDHVHPVRFALDAASGTLLEIGGNPAQTSELVKGVTRFQVTHVQPGLVRIELDLRNTASGATLTFAEFVCARNVLQEAGKRVR